jgi:hypothetical protein
VAILEEGPSNMLFREDVPAHFNSAIWYYYESFHGNGLAEVVQLLTASFP